MLLSFKVSPNTTPSRKLFPNAADFFNLCRFAKVQNQAKDGSKTHQ